MIKREFPNGKQLYYNSLQNYRNVKELIAKVLSPKGQSFSGFVFEKVAEELKKHGLKSR